ncbi:MAG: nucleoside kinase [Treponema sp.]|jgi:uridine kinase|nr:nucleoside kinase [Treponema sp.]
MNDIQVRFANGTTKKGETISCPYGAVADTLLDHFGMEKDTIAAIRVNNEIRPLKTRLVVNSLLEPVLLESPEGAMLYRRSLAFILAIAARTHFPDQGLYIGHSLGKSYYYTFSSGKQVTEQEVAVLQKEMESIVAADLPITFKHLAYEEALEVFKKNRQTDTVLLLDQRSTSRIKVNECKDFVDMYIEPLVSRTSLLSTFALLPYQEGFLLRFPAVGKNKNLGAFEDEPKIFQVYNEYKQWGRIAGVRVVGELNSLVANRTINDYIRIAEAHQRHKIANIAEQIYEQRDRIKMVLLAGPSSSGKTTSAKRLSIELMAMGIKPLAISLDNYYVGTDKTPKDEKGEPDYECLEALDIPFLNGQLQALYRGEEVILPVYDFKIGGRRKDSGETIRLDRNMVLIVEGIHALNDALTPSIARDTKFKVYVSALTQLNLDDHNRIPTSDNRLLRRMVRDNQFRAKDAAGTIKMWPSVQAGERKHIFPFQNTADAALNSALDYELSVLKYYADPLLRGVKPGMYEYAEAIRLLSFLENFAPIPPQYVPGDSILREFIGESEFKY